MFKAISEASPHITALTAAMSVIGPMIEPITDFFGIFGDVMQAGLAESVQKLQEALFTEENIAIISKLAEIAAKLINIGLVPSLSILERLLPLLEAITPGLTAAVDALDVAQTAFEGFFDWLFEDVPKFFGELPEMIMDAIEDAFEGFGKWFENLIEDILGL